MCTSGQTLHITPRLWEQHLLARALTQVTGAEMNFHAVLTCTMWVRSNPTLSQSLPHRAGTPDFELILTLPERPQANVKSQFEDCARCDTGAWRLSTLLRCLAKPALAT